jgi:hypothetical protein
VSKRAIVAALICFVSGCVTGWYVGVSRGVPFVGKEPTDWAIGIYTGESPFELSPARKAANPVLTADDVSDVPARFRRPFHTPGKRRVVHVFQSHECID